MLISINNKNHNKNW